MAWKNIKDHFRISHIVQRREDKSSDGLCIGSGYVSDLIIVNPDGSVKWGALGESSNDDLARYFAEMSADPVKVRYLLQKPDVFERSLSVWTYSGAEIIEKQCEKYGWPNVTHDGFVMYENTFFKEKSRAVQKAKESAQCGIEMYERRVQEITADLQRMKGLLDDERNVLVKLESDHAPA